MMVKIVLTEVCDLKIFFSIVILSFNDVLCADLKIYKKELKTIKKTPAEIKFNYGIAKVKSRLSELDSALKKKEMNLNKYKYKEIIDMINKVMRDAQIYINDDGLGISLSYAIEREI